MFGMGSLFVPIGLLAGLLYWRKQRLFRTRWMLWILVVTVFFVEAAIIAGWWTAEIGRQPWVVYNVLATADGVSPTLSGLDVAVSLGMFIALYAILLGAVPVPPQPGDPARPGAAGGRRDGRPGDAARHVPRDLHAPGSRRLEWRGLMLAEIWFALFVLIVAGYLILDGFDMGVGMLMIPMGKTDDERRTMLNSIGPIWDGNEVWLVIAGGVLFAVFPLVYASLFSGFYLAFMLVLFVMILRTVAMEFRSKEPSPRWRSFWDMVFALASTGLAFLLGVAFGDVLSGVPLDADGNMSVTLIGLLKPVPLLVGATTVAMFAMHGSLYLVQKTEGDLQARIRRAVPRLIAAFFVLNTIVVVAMVLSRQTRSRPATSTTSGPSSSRPRPWWPS